jgi:hypothetical protein
MRSCGRSFGTGSALLRTTQDVRWLVRFTLRHGLCPTQGYSECIFGAKPSAARARRAPEQGARQSGVRRDLDPVGGHAAQDAHGCLAEEGLGLLKRLSEAGQELPRQGPLGHPVIRRKGVMRIRRGMATSPSTAMAS